MTLRIFEGANGYYIAEENADGWHHQPPSWDGSAYYSTMRAAKRALRAAMDDEDEDCPMYWGGTDAPDAEGGAR